MIYPAITYPEKRLENTISDLISAARRVQSRWAAQSVAYRLSIIRGLRGLLVEEADALAQSSARLRGRPVAEALVSEVLPLAEACRFLEENAARLLAPQRLDSWTRPLWLSGVRTEIRREPHGLVLVIGPGNYPLLLPGVQMLQALVAGNAVLVKPAPGASEPMRRLLQLLVKAGLDPALAALLPESTESAQAALAGEIDKVLFTGSAATGERILAQLAPRLVPATLELSGCDAVLIRKDADLDLAIRALIFGLHLNGGETCIAPRRVFVARSLATEVEGRLARELDHANRQGDWPKRTASGRLQSWIDEAVAGGAHFVAGGGGQWPVVLAAVPPTARLLREDIFAPVLSLITVADDEEALEAANDCPYALGASIFTRNETAARHLASRLRAGVVTINDLILPTADPRLPFGGRGRSGYGVTRGADGLLELTAPKVVTASNGRFRPAFDPPQADDRQLFKAYLRLSHGRGWRDRWGGFLEILGLLISRPFKPKQPTSRH